MQCKCKHTHHEDTNANVFDYVNLCSSSNIPCAHEDKDWHENVKHKNCPRNPLATLWRTENVAESLASHYEAVRQTSSWVREFGKLMLALFSTSPLGGGKNSLVPIISGFPRVQWLSANCCPPWHRAKRKLVLPLSAAKPINVGVRLLVTRD